MDLQTPPPPTPIYYCSGGLLGDFITQLSIVCENYYKTGQKGVINIIDSVPFRKSLQETFDDIQQIVKAQPYVEDFRIGMPDNFDVYLSSWRESDQLYKINFYDLFLKEYNIHFGKHKWLHVDVDPKVRDKVVIHTVKYRFPINVNYCEIVEKHGTDQVIFLNMEAGDYDFFVERTGVRLTRIYKPESFTEVCTLIASCKLFIGATSMPLCVAFATATPCIIGRPDNKDVQGLIDGLDKHLPNIL